MGEEMIDTQLVFILFAFVKNKKNKNSAKQVILMKSCYKKFYYLVTFE